MSDTPKCEPPEELRHLSERVAAQRIYHLQQSIKFLAIIARGLGFANKHQEPNEQLVGRALREQAAVADALQAERDAAVADAFALSAVSCPHAYHHENGSLGCTEIDALCARVAVLEEALKPFAEMAEWFLRLYPRAPEHRTFTLAQVPIEESNFSVADLRRAYAALSTGSETNEG